MSKVKKGPGPAPTVPAENVLTLGPFPAAQVGIAASLLMEAFDWSRHPWGHSFWQKVHEELNRMAGEYNG